MVRDVTRVVIDGISGSGKTTLAQSFGDEFLILHLDDWYPGWHGLAAASRITEELLTGARTDYPRWDWEAGRVSELVPVDPARPWVIEGCGALTPITALAADFHIWMDAPIHLAKQRALERDQGRFDPWWDMWHMQEKIHWATHDPQSLADIVLSVS